MKDKERLGQEPAFPELTTEYDGQGNVLPYQNKGMSKRFYAAIELRVPDSGEEWVDEMIRNVNRREAACAAMQGLLSASYYNLYDSESNEIIVKKSYSIADELLRRENL